MKSYFIYSICAAVVRKEWVKMRRLFWIPFVLVVAVLCDALMTYRGVRANHGAMSLWVDLVYKQTIHFGRIYWVFLFSGLWFAALQFIPECSGKRLRLLFHLPVSHRVSLYTMVFWGIGWCLAVFFCGLAGFRLVLALMDFPPQLADPMVGTLLPWGLAAIVAYCTTASVIAEPSRIRKLAFACVGVALASLLQTSSGFSGMTDSLWLYALICLPLPLCIEAAALRVKEGS